MVTGCSFVPNFSISSTLMSPIHHPTLTSFSRISLTFHAAPARKLSPLPTHGHSRSPRRTSPSASASVFPCSRVMLAASSFMFCLMMFWKLNMICCRVRTEVRDHVLNASLAASTAACISPGVDLGTRVITCGGAAGGAGGEGVS